jgi:cell volume regulation protein A
LSPAFCWATRAPYKREIERFHSALVSLGEIVAFVVLGLSVDLKELTRADVCIPGLVLGAVLAFVIRPIFLGLCLIPAPSPGRSAFAYARSPKGCIG